MISLLVSDFQRSVWSVPAISVAVLDLLLNFLWRLMKSKMLKRENLMRQLRKRCQLDLLKKVSAMVDSPEVNPVLPVDDTVDIVPCGSVADSIVGVSVE